MVITDNLAIELAQQLIQIPSISPNDNGCQELISEMLKRANFQVENHDFNNRPVTWAVHGKSGPTLCFLCHTDVVTTGDITLWHHPPFAADIVDGILFGRGAVDMKSGLAAAISAALKVTKNTPNHPGKIAFLITSDEESAGLDASANVMFNHLRKRKTTVDYCIIPEPTATKSVGDTIKIGRRGSINGVITIHGRQGHVAYPQDAINPINLSSNLIKTLSELIIDKGNTNFQPSNLEITQIHSGDGSTNIIPGILTIQFNVRFSPESSVDKIKTLIMDLLNQLELSYDISFELSGNPFITTKGKLLEVTQEAIKQTTNQAPILSTTGGTSDGRFAATYCEEVLELGPSNQTIHQINEHIAIDEINTLTEVYQKIIENLLFA